MRLGRLDEETTANVGVIEGGTASNVVAGRCRIEAEARSLDERKVAEATAAMVDACTWAATEHGCDVDVDVDEVFRGYRQPSSSPAVAARARGARAMRDRAARGRDRRRQRRQRAGRRAASSACCSPTAPRPTTRRPRASPRRGSRRCSRSARRSRSSPGWGTGEARMLKLRRGVVVAVDPLTVEIGGSAAGLGRRGAGRRDRGRRRGRGQHRGARPRPRLGRLRRRPRQPHPRARRAGGRGEPT